MKMFVARLLVIIGPMAAASLGTYLYTAQPQLHSAMCGVL